MILLRLFIDSIKINSVYNLFEISSCTRVSNTTFRDVIFA